MINSWDNRHAIRKLRALNPTFLRIFVRYQVAGNPMGRFLLVRNMSILGSVSFHPSLFDCLVAFMINFCQSYIRDAVHPKKLLSSTQNIMNTSDSKSSHNKLRSLTFHGDCSRRSFPIPIIRTLLSVHERQNVSSTDVVSDVSIFVHMPAAFCKTVPSLT